MLDRTSMTALAALLLVNVAACSMGAERGVGLPPDPPMITDAPAPAEDDEEAQQGLPEEEPILPGIPSDSPSAQTDPASAAPPATKPACDPAKPFGGLSPLPFNTAGYETGGRLSPDELTLYFSRRASGGNMQPFVATRVSKEEPWRAPVVLSAVDSTSDDAYFTTTKDELVGFFASARSGNLQIHRTTRATKTATWSGITVATSLASASTEDDPFVVASGKAIFFDSNRTGTFSVYRASIEEDGSIGAPALVTTGTNAVVTADELTMYFSRVSGAQQEIRVAKRAAATEAWGASSIVSELSSTADDRVTWVSADGCRVIVSSTRAGGAGSSDLFVAAKPQ